MTSSLLEAPTPSPIEYPHAREIPDRTLRMLAEGFEPPRETLRIEGGENIVFAGDMESIRINDIEIPATDDSVKLVAGWANVPKSFLDRQGPRTQEAILNMVLAENHQTALIRLGQRDGILSVLSPDQIPFTPNLVVDVASTVLGEDAPIVSTHYDTGQFYLDVVATPSVMPDLGDPRVGDITKGGLRFNLDISRNLAPTVNPYYYRLWCTNGCSSIHEDTKIDARGLSVDEVLADLEVKARLAFGAVEAEVAAMYELRNTIVDNPERTINRMARDFDLSDRVRSDLVNAIPALVDTVGEVSMFDLIQTATHMANAPGINTRGGRLKLENFGGAVISSHVERCVACASKLN